VEETEPGGLETLEDEVVQVAEAGGRPVEGQVVLQIDEGVSEVLLDVVRPGDHHGTEDEEELVEQSSIVVVVLGADVLVEQSYSVVVVVTVVGQSSSTVVVTVTVSQSSSDWGLPRAHIAFSAWSA